MLDVYIRATQTVEDELDTQLDPVEGQLPTGLRGLLYRNGPGRHEICGHRYGHPFDGDGMILRLELSDTGIHYRNRYVRTRELTEELRAGRPLYRSFGTNLPGGLARNALRLRFKNAANTGVIEFGGKLLALWEGGLPHALDKDTLATLGRYDFQGRLRNTFSPLERMLNTELPFSAHPRICPETGVLYNFGTANGFKPRLMLYQVQPDGRMAAPGHITLKALSFVHDFVLTPNYLVFFLPSVVFDVPRALSGLATPVDTLHGSGKPTRVIAVSRDDFRVVGSWLTEPGFIFHFSNGFQAGDDIVVDGLRLEDLPSAAQVREIIEGRASMYPQPALVRTTLRLGMQQADSEVLFATAGDLPTIDPRQHTRDYRFLWTAAAPSERNDPFQTQILCLDLLGRTEQRRDFGQDIVGEPLFVPDPHNRQEGAGWILMLAYSAALHRSEFYVLDATSLATLARYRLPHHVPPGFHGSFVPVVPAAAPAS
ncbi:MAG: hypothetical protein N838_12910 [Thiohalocapsa sp. PB-PSB1]|jgi:all-trans-8'-apo-beta-carotenal 15,15'-oxygenase|nr:MAG: hypothetical protein N838_12910 [Thiohalocapsa sp. PB-PSB1]